MSFTLIDFVEGFHFLKVKKRFSAGTQSCYFAILTEFQLAGFPEELRLSTRELKELAGLKSVSATHEARNILKNSKLVDFKTVEGVTVYKLGTEHLPNGLPNTYRTLTEQVTEHLAEQQGLVCYTHAQPQSGENGGTLPPLPPTPPISPNPNIQSQSIQSHPITANQPTTTAELRSAQQSKAEDVIELWERMTGTKLEEGEKTALKTFDEVYGRDSIKVAIAAYVYKKGKKFTFFYEWCLKPLFASLKGGEKEDERRNNAVERKVDDGKGRYDDEPERDTGWIYTGKRDTPPIKK